MGGKGDNIPMHDIGKYSQCLFSIALRVDNMLDRSNLLQCCWHLGENYSAIRSDMLRYEHEIFLIAIGAFAYCNYEYCFFPILIGKAFEFLKCLQ